MSALPDALRRAIADVLLPVLYDCSEVALLNFPDHTNVGDNAIWLGETGFLADHGIEVSYSASRKTYSADALRRAIGSEGAILLHGGGNFGDIWPGHQQFTVDVLTAFPRHRVVQLPQTIHFRDDRLANPIRAAIESHKDFVLLVRDEPSRDYAEARLSADARLCPDLAFWLRPEPSRTPTVDVIALMRQDQEAVLRSDSFPGEVEEVDWLGLTATSLRQRLELSGLYRANRILSEHLDRHGTNRSSLLVGAAVRQQMALRRFSLGIDLLSKARIVITDRLHGHILSLLLDKPSIVLDNNYGKVDAFYAAWTSRFPNAHRARSVDEAVAIATAIRVRE